MLERTDTEPDKHSEWSRIRVVSTPGISAMQAAGALAGAPLGMTSAAFLSQICLHHGIQ